MADAAGAEMQTVWSPAVATQYRQKRKLSHAGRKEFPQRAVTFIFSDYGAEIFGGIGEGAAHQARRTFCSLLAETETLFHLLFPSPH